jgi:hypothetical protein
MGQINFQPVTQVAGPYGGTGYYRGISGANEDGSVAGKAGDFSGATRRGNVAGGAGGGITTPSGSAAGGQAWIASPDGSQWAGARGGIVDNPYMTAGAGGVAADTNKGSLAASGAFSYEKASGELDASGCAQWSNKSTGETHNASAMADITKGQGGTITVNKDGLATTYTVPPRPTA